MVVNHLLRQAEKYRARRKSRDVRPQWVTRLIDEVAELFEPVAGVARVGYECRLDDDCWSVGMYLGTNEVIGGRNDGMSRYIDFQFDILQVLDFFTEVQRCSLDSYVEPTVRESDVPASFLTVEGLIADEPLRLRIFSIPPEVAGPGLREFPNGQTEPADG